MSAITTPGKLLAFRFPLPLPNSQRSHGLGSAEMQWRHANLNVRLHCTMLELFSKESGVPALVRPGTYSGMRTSPEYQGILCQKKQNSRTGSLQQMRQYTLNDP